MQKSVLALVALAIGCGPATSVDTSRPSREESAADGIVGGSVTSEFPATGALTRYGSAHCTATLIAPRKVVTAAHCLVGISASSLRFVIGPSLSSAQANIQVVEIVPHPAYDDSSLVNDIGYATLSADAPVAPMKLATMDSSWSGKHLTFVGYGVTSGNGGGAGVKRAVSMPIASVWPTQFSYQTPGKNTCSGDSGGPAFAQVNGEWRVAGVTSYGDAWCQQYGVDTRVDVFAAFLGQSGGGGNPPPPSDPCGGETYEGRCDGSAVVWCENQSVHQQDCAATGKACGYSSEKGYYACVQPAPPDPCQGETYAGRCDGNKVIWCENEQVKSLNCTTCAYSAQKGYYDCV
jgi:V8-like Glu-specific endopeptidase